MFPSIRPITTSTRLVILAALILPALPLSGFAQPDPAKPKRPVQSSSGVVTVCADTGSACALSSPSQSRRWKP